MSDGMILYIAISSMAILFWIAKGIVTLCEWSAGLSHACDTVRTLSVQQTDLFIANKELSREIEVLKKKFNEVVVRIP